jgi:hypothetical protein
MRKAVIASLIYSCSASAGVSYHVTETAGACQDVRIPTWTKPGLKFLDKISTDACEYSFRSQNGWELYIGLMCSAVHWGRAKEKYALDPHSASGARLISESDWEAATPLWPTTSGQMYPRANALPFRGHLFPKSGPKWPVYSQGATTEDSRGIAVYSWDGVIDECTAGPFNCWIWDDHFHGDYWIDLFDVPSASRLVQIRGKFRGVDLTRFQGRGVWPNSRFFVLPIDPNGMRHLLACDLEVAAATHGIATSRTSPPRARLSQQFLEIQDEPLWARFLAMRDEAVRDGATGQIAGVDFKVSLNVRVARRYRVVILLCPGGGPCSVPGFAQPKNVEQHVEEDLRPGRAEISVRFPSDVLRDLGAIGPYHIGRIAVTHPIAEGRGLDYDRLDAGQTQAYDLGPQRP